MYNPSWTMLHPQMSVERLGYIPSFLDSDNPKSAVEQIDDNYQHGGGWRSFKGFKRVGNYDLQYPGDPVYHARALTQLRDEVVVFYDHAWVAVFQPDGSFDVARID